MGAMYKAEGVGLAAPGRPSLRLFVVDGSPFGEGDGGDAGCKDWRVMINPFCSTSQRSAT